MQVANELKYMIISPGIIGILIINRALSLCLDQIISNKISTPYTSLLYFISAWKFTNLDKVM